MFVAKTVYTCPTVKISSGLKMHVYTYAHTHMPTKYIVCTQESRPKKQGCPGCAQMAGGVAVWYIFKALFWCQIEWR